MGIYDYMYNINDCLFMAGIKGILMSDYFSWLTFEWLMENLEWVGAGMILSLIILLLFPILLTIEFRKLSKKED